MEKTNENKTKPILNFENIGPYQAAVFENKANGKVWHNIALTKSWKIGEEWKSQKLDFPLRDLQSLIQYLKAVDLKCYNDLIPTIQVK